TNILLQDATNDPIKRAEVIREVVQGIALIPDEVTVSVFIGQRSRLLDIEERALLTELNKIRIDNSKAKERKANAAAPPMGAADGPPPDLFLTDTEREQAGPVPASDLGISSEVRQEREIVRILLNYGRELVTWEGDGDIPVAPYLLGSIDDVDFVDPPSVTIIEEFRKQAENFEVPEARFFLSHTNKEVADLAIDCIATQYEISPNWNDDKRKIYVSTEIEHLKDLVMQAIYRIKKRKCATEIMKIREEMKNAQSPEDMEVLLFKYQKLKEAEKILGQFLGNTIIK